MKCTRCNKDVSAVADLLLFSVTYDTWDTYDGETGTEIRPDFLIIRDFTSGEETRVSRNTTLEPTASSICELCALRQTHESGLLPIWRTDGSMNRVKYALNKSLGPLLLAPDTPGYDGWLWLVQSVSRRCGAKDTPWESPALMVSSFDSISSTFLVTDIVPGSLRWKLHFDEVHINRVSAWNRYQAYMALMSKFNPLERRASSDQLDSALQTAWREEEFLAFGKPIASEYIKDDSPKYRPPHNLRFA
jgi:hypothetical protein